MKTTEIKIWLLKNGYRQTDIVRDLGVKPSTVCKVIHGKAKSRRVVEWLLKHGCPLEYVTPKNSSEQTKKAA